MGLLKYSILIGRMKIYSISVIGLKSPRVEYGDIMLARMMEVENIC